MLQLIPYLAWPFVVGVLGVVLIVVLRDALRSLVDRIKRIDLPGGAGIDLETNRAADQAQGDVLAEKDNAQAQVEELQCIRTARSFTVNFISWMNAASEFQERSDNDRLLLWAVTPSGMSFVGDNYALFRALARIVNKMGYDTSPPPSLESFNKERAEFFSRRREDVKSKFINKDTPGSKGI